MKIREYVSTSRKLPMLAVAAAVAAVLSGCGGGGGPSGAPPSSPGPGTSLARAPAAQVYSEGTPVTVESNVKTAAGETPDYYVDSATSGGNVILDGASIVQTSGMPEGSTPALPAGATTYYADGTLIADSGSISWNLGVSRTTRAPGLTFQDNALASNDYYDNTKATAKADTHYGLHRVKLSSLWQQSTTNVANATAVFLTDYDENRDHDGDGTAGEAEDDPDYLMFGYWRTERNLTSRPAVWNQAGAFAHGKLPTGGTALGNLKTAGNSYTYKGTAAGMRVAHAGGTTTTTTDFTSPVSLTATFGAVTGKPNSYGTIEGMIALDSDRDLKLKSASIDQFTSTQSQIFGRWGGTTQLLDSDGGDVSGYTGEWAGGFFDSMAADSTVTNANFAAGTFSATGTDETWLGAFMGTKE